MDFKDFSDALLNEMECKRYDDIKKKGDYLELNILIGTDKDMKYKGHSGRMPVISTSMHNCGPEEIACLCTTLKTLINHYKEEYPMEYLFSEIAMGVEDIGTSKIIKNEED